MRHRSITIDAEDKDDFCKQYDERMASLRNKNESKDIDDHINKIDEENNEDEEDAEYLELKRERQKKIREYRNMEEEDEDDDYDGLGLSSTKNGDDNEDDCLADQRLSGEILDDILETEDKVINNKNKNSEQVGLDLLCLYLKNIVENNKGNIFDSQNNNIFYRNKTSLYSLSGNAIYDLNVRQLLDNIINENEENDENSQMNQEENSKEKNSLHEFILKNIESDQILKIMFISNSEQIKTLMVNNFIYNNTNNKIDIKLDNNDDEDRLGEVSDFEIRKKKIRLFNKNVSLQIYETNEKFHKNPISSVYYKTMGGFFIFIEASIKNSKEYLDNINKKIFNFSLNKTIVLFGINMLFKKDCTIDGLDLKEYASENKMIYFPIKIQEFDMKNNNIYKLMNLILIKNIDAKVTNENVRKNSKESEFGQLKNKLASQIQKSASKEDRNKYEISKMKIPNSLGYKKQYRIKHINIFDMDYSKDTFLQGYRNNKKWSTDY